MDELRRRLRSALRKFRLPADELDQYVYIAVFKLIQKHPLRSYDGDLLWSRLLAQEDVVLLPDSTESIPLAEREASRCFIVSGVPNVGAFISKAAKNLVITQDVSPNAKQRNVRAHLAEAAKPSHRLASHESDDGFASLEWLTNEAAARHSELRDEKLAQIRDRVLSRFGPRQAKVIQLWNEGHPPKDLPGMTGYSTAQTYKILSDYTRAIVDTVSEGGMRTKVEAADRPKRKRKKS